MNLKKSIDAKRIKKRLLDADLSITSLARRINRPRETVSKAIHNRRRFPRVRAEVETAIRSLGA